MVDLDDLRDDNGHGEILLDQHFVQIQRSLDKLLVIVPIIPDIKFPVKGVPLLRVFPFLKFEQGLTVLQANWVKFLLQVVEELGGEPQPEQIPIFLGEIRTVLTLAAVLTIFTSVT